MTFSSLLRPFLVVLLAAAGAGCAASSEVPDTETDEEDLRIPGLPFGIGGGRGQAVLQPNGLFSTIVNANGSGCPKGSWKAGISPDGQTFTITFSKYEAKVDPGQASAIKDCQIDVAIVGTKKLVFDVSSFHYQGYVLLENDQMSARQTADYSFGPAGILTSLGGVDLPLPGEVRSQNAVTGPVDESYTYTDTVGAGRPSPCSKASNLHIRTRLRLDNDPQKSGSGYFNTAAIDGSMSFAWKLQWRTC